MAVRVSGWFKLAQRIENGGGLKFAFHEPWAVSFYLWNGDQGVAVIHRKDNNRGPEWGLYGISRSGGSIKPEQWALWATDNSRWRRCGYAPTRLVYDRERLLLLCGPVLLAAVPMPAPPQEVFLETKETTVRGMVLLGDGAAPPPPTAGPATLHRADHYRWNTRTAGTLQTKPDGSVELASNADRAESRAWLDLEPGLHDIVVRLGALATDTGLFVADASGDKIASIGFNETQRGLMLGGLPFGAKERNQGHNLWENRVFPACASAQWLRITAGAGAIRCWVSGDGVGWSLLGDNVLTDKRPIRQFGLFCAETKQPRKVGLQAVRLGTCELLQSAAKAGPPASFTTADQPASGWGNWSAIKIGPDDSRDVVWRAMGEALIAPTNPEASQQVLRTMVTRLLDERRTTAEQHALIDEGLRLAITNRDNYVAEWLAIYVKIGESLARNRHPSPYTAIATLMREAPIASNWGVNPYFPPRLIRYEILRNYYEGRWDDLARLSRSLDFFAPSTIYSSEAPPWSPELERLLQTALAMAELERGEQLPLPLSPWRRARIAQQPPPQRVVAPAAHPLVERLGKEESSVAAELQAALAGKALGDACQVINRLPENAAGMIQLPGDSRLFTSLPVAVDLAIDSTPALAAQMEQQFGAAGRLRLDQSVAAGDIDGVEAVARQFPGTRAGADAHLRLGDRALAAGQPSTAIGQYRHALRESPEGSRAAVLARQQLLLAMDGARAETKLAGSVTLAGRTYTPDDWQQFIAAVAKARSGRADGEVATTEQGGPAWLGTASELSIRRFAALPARRDIAPDQPWQAFDALIRQTALVADRQSLLVADSAGVSAIDLGSGNVRWTSALPEAKGMSRGTTPAMIAVAEQRVFVRLPDKATRRIEVLQLSTGTPLWVTADTLHVISDPVVTGGEVLAVVTDSTVSPHGTRPLRLARWSVENGELRKQTPLFDVYDWRSWEPSIRLTMANQRLVGCGAGCVFAADVDGRLRWLRKARWLALPHSHSYDTERPLSQVPTPPLVVQQFVIVSQPGVAGIEAYDADSGQLLWSLAEPEARGLIGQLGDHLAIETFDGFAAVRLADGKPQWQRDASLRTHFPTIISSLLYYVDRAPRDLRSDRTGLWLHRIDSSGDLTSSARLGRSMPETVLYGPLYSVGARAMVLLSESPAAIQCGLGELQTK